MARLNQSERDRLNREIGIRDKRIQSLENKLEENAKRTRELEFKEDANLALCTAIVKKYGECVITLKELNDIIDSKTYVKAKSVEDDVERLVFTLSVEVPEK